MLSCPVVQLFLLALPADKRLAIKAQTNCSEFTLVFCCTVQLALGKIMLKFFPSLPPFGEELGLLFVIQISLDHSCVVRLSLRSDFPQASWLRCL